MNKSSVAYLGVISFFLLSCGSDPLEEQRERVEADICDFERSRPNTVISYVDNRRGIVMGEIINRAEVKYERIASAMAATKRDVIRKRSEGWGYCCGWINPMYYWCGYQYCQRIEEYSLKKAFGLGRAPTLEQAEEMAIENCESAAEQLAEEIGTSSQRSAFDCYVKTRAFCY
ncbi:hypothetical protein [Photobacterium galatheae]|uniref:Lipoprotein n=1 Tax=Photobacterium galatheae TaxID=1654360 RepID=A0A066RLR1_9GAMM|nr:hypothetical protein [Photobacterium galatheae]KDM91274.1 hypothetical protein EA58_11920 [Photobacterium galatheae]MCM0150325.1 hypothetical protein [Photobacterium galatheae]